MPDQTSLVLLIGAANRDPARFEAPDTFDINRRQTSLGFGTGPHLCIGKSLALVEAATMLRTLLQAWREIDIGDGGWEWLDNSSFRGLSRLDLQWQPAIG